MIVTVYSNPGKYNERIKMYCNPTMELCNDNHSLIINGDTYFVSFDIEDTVMVVSDPTNYNDNQSRRISLDDSYENIKEFLCSVASINLDE